jgi:hypothetical protein
LLEKEKSGKYKNAKKVQEVLQEKMLKKTENNGGSRKAKYFLIQVLLIQRHFPCNFNS